jgi:hypothetical protein
MKLLWLISAIAGAAVGIWFIKIITGAYRGKRGRVTEIEKVEVGKSYDYYCQLCGYRWTWRTGEPQPRINLRPDLIAKGNQRLEEEEKKRLEDAAAAWWYQEQRKKKK